MKVSVVTAIKDCGEFLQANIDSVYEQTHSDIEHIIIDACSQDSTESVVKKNESKVAIYARQEDRGIFDGINKGLRLATGDILAILNGDDIYADNNVISEVVREFTEYNTDCVYGDLVYVRQRGINKVVRYWRSGEGDRAKLLRGWMPPHPSFFVKREIYEKYGYFNTDFRISADYEIILRFLYMHRISMRYMHKLCVKMRIGGNSNRNLFRIMRKTYEDYKACRIYGIKGASFAVMLKNVRKVPQFFRR